MLIRLACWVLGVECCCFRFCLLLGACKTGSIFVFEGLLCCFVDIVFGVECAHVFARVCFQNLQIRKQSRENRSRVTARSRFRRA